MTASGFGLSVSRVLGMKDGVLETPAWESANIVKVAYARVHRCLDVDVVISLSWMF